VYSPGVRVAVAFLSLALLARVAGAQAPDQQSDDQKRGEAERACAAHSPTCDWLGQYSSLERASLSRGLAARGLQIEPQPWGKPVAKVLIYNENVFAEDNWLNVFNFIHYTTRERAIRDELTIKEGDVWNDELVQESARRLRDPLYSSVVALVPVKSTYPNSVDLLVVTRDVWSLRFNTQYEYLSPPGALTSLSISISENNFLGNRDVLAATLRMDLGALAVGPLFIDKNVLGTHVSLSASFSEILTRQSLDVFGVDPTNRRPSGDPRGLEDAGVIHTEGSNSSVSLSYPLWSLASEWGGGISFGHSNSVARRFFFNGLQGYDAPSTPQDDLLPWEYELHTWTANANVVRQWGTYLKQQFAIGQTVSSTRPSLLANFPNDPVLQAQFIRDVFPRSERISTPYIEYSFFMPRYRVLRNVATYALAEDLRTGPDLDIALGEGVHFLGSDYHFTQPTASLGWTFPWCNDGFVRVSGGASYRFQNAISHGTPVDSIDNSANAQIRAASPILRYLRIVAQANIATRWNDTQNGFLTIGADSGLRGYAINQFYGQRRVSAIFEARSLPIPIWVLRVGGVAFYEAGGAANSLAEMPIYQDVGFGVRMLIPQTSRDLFRFDLAFPLRAAPGWPAFQPHFLAGFAAYF
jgi:hypothetical protein